MVHVGFCVHTQLGFDDLPFERLATEHEYCTLPFLYIPNTAIVHVRVCRETLHTLSGDPEQRPATSPQALVRTSIAMVTGKHQTVIIVCRYSPAEAIDPLQFPSLCMAHISISHCASVVGGHYCDYGGGKGVESHIITGSLLSPLTVVSPTFSLYLKICACGRIYDHIC